MVHVFKDNKHMLVESLFVVYLLLKGWNISQVQVAQGE